MIIKKVSPMFYVSAQISPGEIGMAAAEGIKTIINNRPDNEAPDQPHTQAIIDAASANGIEFLHIPIVAGSISDANIEDFTNAYRNAKGPILAYCRSGMRSTSMWALAEAGTLETTAIIAIAQDVGYDIAGLRPLLEARASTAAGSKT